MFNGHGLEQGVAEEAPSPGPLPGMLQEGLTHSAAAHVRDGAVADSASATLLHCVPTERTRSPVWGEWELRLIRAKWQWRGAWDGKA